MAIEIEYDFDDICDEIQKELGLSDIVYMLCDDKKYVEFYVTYDKTTSTYRYSVKGFDIYKHLIGDIRGTLYHNICEEFKEKYQLEVLYAVYYEAKQVEFSYFKAGCKIEKVTFAFRVRPEAMRSHLNSVIGNYVLKNADSIKLEINPQKLLDKQEERENNIANEEMSYQLGYERGQSEAYQDAFNMLAGIINAWIRWEHEDA